MLRIIGKAFVGRILLLQSLPGVSALIPAVVFENNVQVRHYAARRSTRERKLALKRKRMQGKVEVVKESFLQRMLKLKKKVVTVPGRYDPDKLEEDPIDDVYRQALYKESIYLFTEAIDLLKEIHHPTMYNEPNIMIQATIELDTRLPKKNRYMERFHDFVKYPHDIKLEQERKVLAVCEDIVDQEKAMNAGAWFCGGKDIIKKFQLGEITAKDFNYLVAHPDMIMELAKVRGLLKLHFPNKSKGNIGQDMELLVEKFLKGIDISSVKHPIELDFHWVEAPIGQLSMPIEHLEENFYELVNVVYGHRPEGDTLGPFITRTLLNSRISGVKFSFDFWKYLPKDAREREDKTDEVAEAS